MTNGEISSNKNSRLLFSNVPDTYAEFKRLLESSGLPVDVLFNAEGWTVLPTLLNRHTLVSEQLEFRLFGQDGDHTVSEAIEELIHKVGDIFISKRQNVGDKYLLCNGDELSVDSKDYTELVKLLPKSPGTPRASSLPNLANNWYIDDTAVHDGYYYVLLKSAEKQFKVYRSKDIKTWQVTKVGTSSYDFANHGGLLITDDYVSVFTACNIPTNKRGQVFYIPLDNFTTSAWKSSSYSNNLPVASKPVYALGKYIFFPMYANSPAGPWSKITETSYIPAGWQSYNTTPFGGSADSEYLYVGIYQQLLNPPHKKAIIRTRDLTSFEVFNVTSAYTALDTNTPFVVLNGKLFLIDYNEGVSYVNTATITDGFTPTQVFQSSDAYVDTHTQLAYLPETEEYAYISNDTVNVFLFKLDGAYRKFKVGTANLRSYGVPFHTENLFLAAPSFSYSPSKVFALDMSEVATLPEISISDVYTYIRAKE